MIFKYSLFLYWMTFLSLTSISKASDDQTFYRNKEFIHQIDDKSGYYSKIKPILDKRCVVCHSCNESPCQLKLESIEGLLRGSKRENFKGKIFSSTQGNRLYFDAKEITEWRERGFFSVIDDFKYKGEVLAPSVMMQSLMKKMNKTDKNFDYKFFDESIKAMPYGLANLDEETEYAPLIEWLSLGAKTPSKETIEKAYQVANPKVIKKWEDFFNDRSYKGRWTARYLYEHLFENHFYIEEAPGEFFELVRSKTASPEEIIPISSAHETDDPNNNLNKITMEGVGNFYYRLRKINSSIVFKNHILYKVNNQTLFDLKKLFFESDWGGTSAENVPFNFNYSNPFFSFKAIPAKIRYTWMLKNAEMLMKVIMSGPNCRIKNAGSMIWDNYLAVFLKPESDITVTKNDFFESAAKFLPIPNTIPGTNRYLLNYSDEQIQYADIKLKLEKKFRPDGYYLNDIWTGDGKDKNSLLTIFRHMDYATAHSGHLSEHPHSVHLFNYANFERLYYLCVISSTFRDSALYQVPIVNYLFDLKKELDEEFLSFVPEKLREKQKAIYTNGKGRNYDYPVNYSLPFNPKNAPILTGENFSDVVRQLISNVYSKEIIGNQSSLSKVEKNGLFVKLSQLNNSNINIAKNFPENSYIKIIGKDNKNYYFTLLVDRYHDFLNHILTDNISWTPKLDQFQVLDDIKVDFPNKIFIVNEGELKNFIEEAQNVNDRYDYLKFDIKYALQKKSRNFWSEIDEMQMYFHKKYPIESGIIDLHKYGRYDLELPSYKEFEYQDE